MKTHLIEVKLSKIIVDEKRQDQIIVLKEKGGERQFPIVIGLLEVSSIKMKLSGVNPPRPLTHDLLVSVIKSLNAKIKSLVIDQMIKNTFHAKLEIKSRGGKQRFVDARPSDGIALAVRVGVPIFVDEVILEKAAFFPS